MFLLLAILAGVQLTEAVCSSSCTARYQCSSCSANYYYVDCINGACACLTNQGFANVSSLCDCPTPKQVYWKNGTSPYCVNLDTAAQCEVNSTQALILQNQVKRLFQNMVYPTSALILNKTILLDDLFAPNGVGRIDPLTIIEGGSILVEYFYAFSIVRSPGSLIYVNQVDFVSLGVNMTGPLPIVFNRVRVHFSLDLGNGVLINVLNWTISGTFTMAPNNNTIIKVDQILHNIGFATDVKLANRTQYIDSLCQTYVKTCNSTFDPDGFYSNYDDCFAYLTSPNVRNTTWNGQQANLPVTYDQAAGNTIVCRQVHLGMAAYDPTFHCKHVGKTGGGMCSDAAGLFGPKPGPYYTNYDSDSQRFD